MCVFMCGVCVYVCVVCVCVCVCFCVCVTQLLLTELTESTVTIRQIFGVANSYHFTHDQHDQPPLTLSDSFILPYGSVHI